MKILVTGGSGMVGKCIKDLIGLYPTHGFTFLSSKDCDLTNRYETQCYFQNGCFDYVIHLAANVGGLYKNMNKGIEMFSDNIKINENVLEACKRYSVNRGIFVLSSCIYTPEPSKFPMDESMIHEGPPHPSNEGYAYAKRMLELQCRQYNKKFNTKYMCLIPVNLYGPYDNFRNGDAHVIPDLMARFHKDKINDDESIVFGTGEPLRQFLYAKDFAKLILNVLLDNTNIQSMICCNDEVKISKMVDVLSETMEMDKEKMSFDVDMPNGCMRKTVSNEKLKSIYPDFKFTSLKDGLRETYNWFKNNYPNNVRL
jgi:GDP-L-fucose synthase